MTTKMRWFKFYPGDWALDTQGMTPLAKGLYVDMLCMQWAGRRLPADFEELTIMMPAMTERTYRELLQHFVVEDGWLVNNRLERERADAEGRSENGRAAARRKYDVGSGRNAAAVPPHSGRIAAALPPQCHQEAEADTEEDKEEEEEEKATPRKRGRPADPLVWSWESGFTGITGDDIARWNNAYGQIDVDSEIKQADEHVRAYPEKQHMKRWRRFLTEWLARSNRWAIERAQRGNDAPARSGAPKRSRAHIPEDAHPDDEHLWFMTNGWTPRQIPIYRTRDGRERWMNGDYIDETPSQGDSNENDE